MKVMRVLLPVFVSLTMAACSTTRPSMSYVANEITAADAAKLATDTVAHISAPLPPAKTTIVLDAPALSSGQKDVLTPVMVEKLRARGYGVMQADEKTGPTAGQGTVLRYLASPMSGGVVLRLQYLQSEASRFYPRASDGSLAVGAPFTVREGGAQNGK